MTKYQELEPKIHQILRDRGIEFDEDVADFAHRPIKNERETVDGPIKVKATDDDLTVLIHASWKSDDDAQEWLLAAQDIRNVLVSSPVTKNVKVELISWQLTSSQDYRRR